MKLNEYVSKNSGSSSSDNQKNNLITVGELGDDQSPASTSIARVNEVDAK